MDVLTKSDRKGDENKQYFARMEVGIQVLLPFSFEICMTVSTFWCGWRSCSPPSPTTQLTMCIGEESVMGLVTLSRNLYRNREGQAGRCPIQHPGSNVTISFFGFV
ncbi:uncharacterized protein PV06_01879 [Exophiala oligosperma]|uniref:Uncharacterized protein n=1 Tax=Exophiala oligosperma TaxID=215243 RepID=A0A0D2EE47_9EURO|nr:uncharacterized protein PV06_01879 [Exophiala oligosperma]KIW46194.1 hypothetical protein PV06_01879 [Exophiala oligosperma]